jgi:hypothetical protein
MMLVSVAAFFGGYVTALLMSRPAPPSETGVSKPLPPAIEAPKDEKKCKTVIVYRDRPIKLPEAKQTEHTTATARLEAEERPYTLSSTWDEQSGESRIWAQPEPLPLFSLSDKGHYGLHYGVKGGDPVIRASLSQEVFKVKDARAGVNATIDSDGQWFAGIGVEVRY